MRRSSRGDEQPTPQSAYTSTVTGTTTSAADGCGMGNDANPGSAPAFTTTKLPPGTATPRTEVVGVGVGVCVGVPVSVADAVAPVDIVGVAVLEAVDDGVGAGGACTKGARVHFR